MNFSTIRGQEAVKRAITVALAGQHSICLLGPSGNGKTMLISAAKALDPSLEAVEVRTSGKCQDDTVFSDNAVLCDIHIEVPPVPFRELFGKSEGTDSDTIAKRIKWVKTSRDLSLSDRCLLLMKQAYDELGMNPRSATTAVRVARTIAMLENAEKIDEMHLAEAVQYRLLDRKQF